MQYWAVDYILFIGNYDGNWSAVPFHISTNLIFSGIIDRESHNSEISVRPTIG